MRAAIVLDYRPRYLVDVYDLGWVERWEIALLFDVIEHSDDDVAALRQVARSLVPGGLAFITTPGFSEVLELNRT